LQAPSEWAQIGAAFGPPGAEDASAQLLQAGWNVGVAGSSELMQGAIDTYGNPTGDYNNILIEQAIADGVEAAGRTEPLEETFIDNEDVFDAETGANLTDESLRE
jgi:hypothetical protein